ncbi:OmpA family protein [Cetobacterium somerae]|uniref:OmpA family protein n=1 Tax=Cetobacterium TaxID=180162 RepID=UPI001F058CAA|nr:MULTISPECIES: OmpA family protein [Cetobacterium]MCX3067679.1 OmpA family protein [Cetobacterium somerae]UPO97586.1 OmpA family protein [Cetobacterium somerae]
MKNTKLICSVLLAGSLFGACTATGYNSKTTGTAGGAAVGALIGQAIGQDTKGTLIGAGIGALAGLGWGAYKDQQTKELQARLQNTQVKVTDEGNYINLNLPGGVTFPTNGYVIGNGFYGPLNDIAAVLNQYPETRIVISGNTDNTGAYSYNMNLSVKRARSVADYLVRRGVNPNRVTINGYGPDRPIASNSTASGRAQNRRVEIQIFPAY